ncbi:hypothetical protein GO816_18525 [Mucilaginibacter sp. HME9299]|uniref:Sigma-70 family RNA polymerase sigma factor n=1 Tax=Mucilaginibacter aquatilis TaxID=1517760 RepID=A0A6I4IRM7_9SPHI|nr:hypothetical protein [Mucilaginibacter aquatilis]
MNLNIEKAQHLTNSDILATRALFYRYGSWLLGYIVEIVKDHEVAEQYLADIFKEVPYKLNELNSTGSDSWKQLRMLAQARLKTAYNRNLSGKELFSERLKFDGVVSGLTIEQQIVFCGVYYYQKSTAILAHELNLTDAEVKKILREAFIMMKNG